MEQRNLVILTPAESRAVYRALACCAVATNSRALKYAGKGESPIRDAEKRNAAELLRLSRKFYTAPE